MISLKPCNSIQAKPKGNINMAGQRTKPPALLDISWVRYIFKNRGKLNQTKVAMTGNKNKIRPNKST